jgi:hypothetical protein
MNMLADGWDDDDLLAALRQAVRERQAVPPEFVEAGQNAFAWRNFDAELAQLTYDSAEDAARAAAPDGARDDDKVAAVRTGPASGRAERASVRALTYTSVHLTIELEVTQDSLLGQVVPAQPATIRVQPRTGAEATLEADEIGRFSVQPIPAAPFRLHCRTAPGVDAVTGWISL